jgi:dUTP pyrophosphatase
MLEPVTWVNIKLLDPFAEIPVYATHGDGGMDIVATSMLDDKIDSVTYGTGIAMEIPYGYVGFVYPRSSIRGKELVLANSVAVIDHGYRGELMFTFKKTNGYESKKYEVGNKIVQIIIQQRPTIVFRQVDELSHSERGTGGFGSTGK